jgi:hypothetical protein
MARQGRQVQLDESDIRLALNMAKMAQGEFSCTTIQQTHNQIKKPRAEIPEDTKQGIEFLGHKNVEALIDRHLAMLYPNHTARCLPGHNGNAKNPQTLWGRK